MDHQGDTHRDGMVFQFGKIDKGRKVLAVLLPPAPGPAPLIAQRAFTRASPALPNPNEQTISAGLRGFRPALPAKHKVTQIDDTANRPIDPKFSAFDIAARRND